MENEPSEVPEAAAPAELASEPTVTTPEAVAAPTPAANTKKTWMIAGASAAVALVVAIGGVKILDKSDSPTALAATNASSQPNGTNGNFMRPNAGKITAIDGSSFTIAATDFNNTTTNVKVTTSKDTTFHDKVEGTVSDLKVGDNVIVNGATADGVVTAERISEGELVRNRVRGNGDGNRDGNGPQTFTNGTPPEGAVPNGGQFNGPPPGATNGNGGQFQRMNFTAGEIKSISGDTIVLTGADGTDVTVKTTDATKVTVTKTIKLSNLKVGDSVRVIGQSNNGTVAATEVTRGALEGRFGGGPMLATNGQSS